MNLWQPCSLREVVAGRQTPAPIADTVDAWVVRDLPPSPANGPLGGVALGVKDIIDVAGVPSQCGSVLRADALPAEVDADIVTAWRRAGAMPVGKTVTAEFAYFGPGPTRNPVDPSRTPGGSSSGSAAAVAAGHVPLAVGTQTAGSVIRPASFCGIASLVMTHGRIPMTGVCGVSPSLDSHGVFAASVSDLALAWSALTGEPDPGLASPAPPRLLVVTRPEVEPEMAAAFAAACSRLAGAGAVVNFAPGPLAADLTAAHFVVMAYEAARERAAEMAFESQLSPPLVELLKTGAATFDSDYQAALETVADARTRVASLFGSYDAVLSPAALGPAPVGLSSTGDPLMSRPWQALGLPAVAVPGLRSAAGLPLGLQLIGPRGGEAALLAVGCWVEGSVAR